MRPASFANLRRAAVIAALTGALLSLAGFIAAERVWDIPSAQRQINELGENRRLMLEEGIGDSQHMIDVIAEAISAEGGSITGADFNELVARWRDEFIQFGQVGWVPRVPREGRAAFADGASDHRIRDFNAATADGAAPDRPEYFPLASLSGGRVGDPLLGVDMASEPKLRQAMDSAIDDDRVASDVALLETGARASSTVVSFKPVYAKGLPRRTIAERRAALTGYVVGLTSPDLLLDRVLAKVNPQGLDVYLYRSGSAADALPVCVRSSLLRNRPAVPLSREVVESGLHWTGSLQVADTRWEMVVSAMPDAPFLADDRRASIILVAGLLLTATATIYTGLVQRATAQIRDARDRLSFSNLLLSTAMDATPDGMLIVDDQKRVLSSNRRMIELFRVPPEIAASDDDEPLLAFVTASVEEPDKFLARVRYLYQHPEEVAHEDISLRDGRIFDRHSAPLLDAAKHYLGRIWFFRDVTNERFAAEQLTAQARVDALTGIANRRTFDERLALSFAEARRGGPAFAVLALDLDHFKVINDTLGHAAGDAVLAEVGRRLRSVVRETDLVARLGGDEFAILQSKVTGVRDAEIVAAKIRAALAKPYRLNGSVAHATASVGIALHSSAVAGPAALLEGADRALYRAKEEGRDRYCFASFETVGTVGKPVAELVQ